MKYYHGTTTIFLPGIRKNGLLAPEVTGNRCENRTRNLDFVFLADNVSVAYVYACRAAEKHGGEPCVLEVDADGVPERTGRSGRNRFNQYRMLEFRRIRKIERVLDNAHSS